MKQGTKGRFVGMARSVYIERMRFFLGELGVLSIQ